MRRRSIRNRGQLAFLLLLLALLNLADTADECNCTNPEDGELFEAIMFYDLRAFPPMEMRIKAGQGGSVGFSCPEKDRAALPVEVTFGPGLEGSTTQTSNGASAVFTAKLAPEKFAKNDLGNNTGCWEETQGLLNSWVNGILTNMLPFADGGFASCSVQIETTSPDFAVPWQREYMQFKGPAIATAKGVYFPETPVGKSSAGSVMIQNKGDQALNVSFAIDPNDGIFSTPSAMVVPPGGAMYGDTTFSPTSAGSKTSKLVIRSNDPKFSSFTIWISGTGVNQPPPT